MFMSMCVCGVCKFVCRMYVYVCGICYMYVECMYLRMYVYVVSVLWYLCV